MPTPDLSDVFGHIGGALSELEGAVLADLAASTEAAKALEVGHYLGLSTAVLLKALPPQVELITVDHHRGDAWSGSTSFDEFMLNVSGHIGDRRFAALNEDMRSALPDLTGRFGFCFYDADHTAQAVADFWELAEPLLDDTCTLVFDDADWAEQSTLRTLAEDAGFTVVTGRPFWRGDRDKYDPDTYTLEVMHRA